MRIFRLIFGLCLILIVYGCAEYRATGSLGVVIERARGSVLIVDTNQRRTLARIDSLGDLSHASVVFSHDQRYAFIFGRDGHLSKIDLLQNRLSQRIIQAGNSIGGAISQNGKLIAVSNYTPGGVKVFSTESLRLVADIPAVYGQNQLSKVVGLVDAPNQRFVFSLFDAGEIWVADMHNPRQPIIKKFKGIGEQPYDALLTPDGRYYIAGLFAEPGLARLDLWHLDAGVKRILPDYGKLEDKLPVYKMPHLEGWAVTGHLIWVPAIGQHEVLVIDQLQGKLIQRIPVAGQPVFVVAQPDGRHIWVNFAFPDNGQLQVIDAENYQVIQSIFPGEAVLHLEFTPRGDEVWVSVRDDNQLVVYDTETFSELKRLPAEKPSGIFFTSRAYKIGL